MHTARFVKGLIWAAKASVFVHAASHSPVNVDHGQKLAPREHNPASGRYSFPSASCEMSSRESVRKLSASIPVRAVGPIATLRCICPTGQRLGNFFLRLPLKLRKYLHICHAFGSQKLQTEEDNDVEVLISGISQSHPALTFCYLVVVWLLLQ